MDMNEYIQGTGQKCGFRQIMNKELGWTPLHCMVEKENVTSVKELLSIGGELNSCDNFGRTSLSVATAKQNLELVQLIVEAGANVNEGFPLHFACEKGNYDIVNYLIERGADVNLERAKNYPILIAAAKGNLEIVKLLHKHAADLHVADETKQTALHWACDNGNADLVSFLIDCGCDIEVTDTYQLIPLEICLIRQEKRPDLVKLFLEKGARVDKTDVQGSIYLHFTEHPDSIVELIKYGADVNFQNMFGETPMYSASHYGLVDCALALLRNKANPNIPATGGWTPLHLAAAEGHLEYVEELLKYQADVNATSAENITPLHLAAYNGHVKIVELLLQQGSFVNIPVINLPDINTSVLPPYARLQIDCNECTPLALAAAGGHTEICNRLLHFGAFCDTNVELPEEASVKSTEKRDDWLPDGLFAIVRTNNVDEVKNLPQGANLESKDSMGWTPLHHATEKGFYDMCCELIRKGVSVNALDKYKRTPLSIAAAKNHFKILELLLDNGAEVNSGFSLFYAVDNDSFDCITKLIKHNCDVNLKNETNSQSPVLVQAAWKSKSAAIQLLLEHNADPNVTNKWGETALHCACMENSESIVKLLIDHGANVNIKDTHNDTPLIIAGFSKQADIVNLLLENGADSKAANNFKTTALHRACVNCEISTKKLLEAGARVNACNDEYETPLFAAAENVSTLKILIENGANVNHRTPDGWTPLHECADRGNRECVQELLKNGANVNAASAENVLPIYLAAIRGYSAVVKELLDNGSYLDLCILNLGNIRDDSGILPLVERYHIVPGNTPLIGASSKGFVEVVQILHSYGAILDNVNFFGNTALHEAVLSNSVEVIEYLLMSKIDLSVRNKNQKTALDLAKELLKEDIANMIENYT